MGKVLYGQIASVTDLANLRDRANGAPYLGISKTGQIYVFEGGAHKTLQPQEAIEKTGIDPELLNKVLESFGLYEEPEVHDDEFIDPEPEPEPEPQLEQDPEPEPEAKEVLAPEQEKDPEPEPEPELNVSRRVYKRIARLEDLLVKAAEELATLKSEITQ